MEPFQDRFALLGHATVSLGAVASHLGRLAAVVGDWERAEVLFERGRTLNEEAAAKPWLARALFDEGRERLLRHDMDEGQHEMRTPMMIWESRNKYKDNYKSTVFRQHIYQEAKRRKFLAQYGSRNNNS